MKYKYNLPKLLRVLAKESNFGILVGVCGFIRGKCLIVVKAFKIERPMNPVRIYPKEMV